MNAKTVKQVRIAMSTIGDGMHQLQTLTTNTAYQDKLYGAIYDACYMYLRHVLDVEDVTIEALVSYTDAQKDYHERPQVRLKNGVIVRQ